MKRILYFLKDSVSGKFYDQSNDLVDFKKATIFFMYKSVQERRRELINRWEWHAGNVTSWKDDAGKTQELDKKKFAEEIERDINARKNLPDWGIQVVCRIIEA